MDEPTPHKKTKKKNGIKHDSRGFIFIFNIYKKERKREMKNKTHDLLLNQLKGKFVHKRRMENGGETMN